MTQWWNALRLMQQIVFVIACATTLFMLGQIVMMLIGFGESDIDADAGDIDVPDTDAPTLDVDPGQPESDVGFRLFGLKILPCAASSPFSVSAVGWRSQWNTSCAGRWRC